VFVGGNRFLIYEFNGKIKVEIDYLLGWKIRAKNKEKLIDLPA
jgi:hypothetical protein